MYDVILYCITGTVSCRFRVVLSPETSCYLCLQLDMFGVETSWYETNSAAIANLANQNNIIFGILFDFLSKLDVVFNVGTMAS